MWFNFLSTASMYLPVLVPFGLFSGSKYLSAILSSVPKTLVFLFVPEVAVSTIKCFA